MTTHELQAEAAAKGCVLKQQRTVSSYTRRGWQGRPKAALKERTHWQVYEMETGKVLVSGKTPAQAMKRWRGRTV